MCDRLIKKLIRLNKNKLVNKNWAGDCKKSLALFASIAFDYYNLIRFYEG